MSTFRISRQLLFVLPFGSLICVYGMPPCGAESLPETVKRHEDQIKALADQVKALKDSIDSMQGNKSDLTSRTDQTPAACTKDFAKIGRNSYSSSNLESVIDVRNSGIIIKYIRSVIPPGAEPNYVIVASNVDELNNKKLHEGASYTFIFRNCRYVLALEKINPNNLGEILILLLNYE